MDAIQGRVVDPNQGPQAPREVVTGSPLASAIKVLAMALLGGAMHERRMVLRERERQWSEETNATAQMHMEQAYERLGWRPGDPGI